MLVVRFEEAFVTRSGGEPTVGQDEPLVTAEPLVAVDVHEHDCGKTGDNPQRERRGTIPSDAQPNAALSSATNSSNAYFLVP